MTINNFSTFDLHLDTDEYKALIDCIDFLENFLRDGYEDADYIEDIDTGKELYRTELEAATKVLALLGKEEDSRWERY